MVLFLQLRRLFHLLEPLAAAHYSFDPYEFVLTPDSATWLLKAVTYTLDDSFAVLYRAALYEGVSVRRSPSTRFAFPSRRTRMYQARLIRSYVCEPTGHALAALHFAQSESLLPVPITSGIIERRARVCPYRANARSRKRPDHFAGASRVRIFDRTCRKVISFGSHAPQGLETNITEAGYVAILSQEAI